MTETTNKNQKPAASTATACSAYPWQDAWDALRRTVEEDRNAMKTLVDAEDSACNARNLRRERMMAMEHVLALMDDLEHWQW